ncbi:uncharacterized protein LOC109604174 isoform X2 [Aethina tumida]|uniref:uncharacterized protein LOC109604174 isoform X2 n=1 Tax=Aethina tumida TaxID=116153 RepID=UPI0021484960|nr:uncharacterized protein LOC109604174 isoform X2 [Aethina tumida]
MSVLNQSGEEQQECPLCMEPLEVDDLNFYPCTCEYQICRFCWHRIRTDGNGLCPACRKAYSENPADFIPLSQEQVAKLKAEKRQRDQQRKAKLSESRKHLASVRVVQRNLVFVVGLPVRLADAETLRRHEYFGKFGKIHKVVINQSTSYAGSQGPSASAYVTYMKSDDALRAIQSVNNITIDGRQIKSSLGTTKYCSHFMKNQPCPKPDCMYLHDFGDPEASFTKEQMHAGKHQEYERKLHDALVARTNNNNNNSSATTPAATTTTTTAMTTVASAPPTHQTPPANSGKGCGGKEGGANGNGGATKDGWPQLNVDKEPTTKKEKEKAKKSKTKSASEKQGKDRGGKGGSDGKTDGRTGGKADVAVFAEDTNSNVSSSPTHDPSDRSVSPESIDIAVVGGGGSSSSSNNSGTTGSSSIDRPTTPPHHQRQQQPRPLSAVSRQFDDDDNTSFFSSGNTFARLHHRMPNAIGDRDRSTSDDGDTTATASGGDDDADDERSTMSHNVHHHHHHHVHHHPHESILTDVLPNINTSEDWVAAFGLNRQPLHRRTGSSTAPSAVDIDRDDDDGFGVTPLMHNGFGKDIGLYNDAILDMLNKTTVPNGFGVPPTSQSNAPHSPQAAVHNGHNGLDNPMSKFFMDFHNNKQQQQQNGLTNHHHHNSHHHQPHSYLNQTERLIYLQQKQLEEQLFNMNFGNKLFGGGSGGSMSVFPQQNGLTGLGNHYMNGGDHSPSQFPLYGGGGGGGGTSTPTKLGSTSTSSTSTSNSGSREDELDFDPIQETQKAFAEMMANEQQQKQNGTARQHQQQQNGGSSYLPPPPPGFVQPTNTHMNSFGSKIFPFLSMSSSSSQVPQTNSQQNWPSNFSSPSPPQQSHNPHKNSVSNTDWKVLDPAILSSSRHFSLASNVAPMREHYPPNLQLGSQQIQQQQQPQNGIPPQLRNFDFTNNAFSSFTQQFHQHQQPSYNSYTQQLNNLNQSSLNWFGGGELNTNTISSPPGFRNQTTKQQEC